MITPIEIQSKTFKSGGLGYDKKDVDGFLREVLKSYEAIYRENMELNDKVTTLTKGLQYYRTIEKTLQKALVLAEKTSDDTKTAAMEKAKVIEREAHTHAQLIIADAKNELEHIQSQTVQLVQQYEKYKAQFKHLAAAQMEMIESEAFDLNISRLESFITTGAKESQPAATSQYGDDAIKEAAATTEDEDLAASMDHISASMEPFVPDDNYTEENKSDPLDDDPDPFDELAQQEDFSFFNLDDEDDKKR